MTPVYKGPLQECLVHYSYSTWRGKHMEALAEFTGASLRGTVERWVKDDRRPVGEYALKAQHFLSFYDYHVDEVERLDPVVRRLGEIVAFSIRSAEQMASDLDYSKDGRVGHASSQLYQVLLAGTGMVPVRMAKAQEIGDKYVMQLDEKRQEFEKNRLTLTSAYKVIGKREDTKQGVLTRRSTIEEEASQIPARLPVSSIARIAEPENGSCDRFVVVAGALAKSLAPHVSRLASSRTTSHQRRKFIEAAGDIKQLAENLLVIATQE